MNSKYIKVMCSQKIYRVPFLLYEIKNNVPFLYDMENNLYYYGNPSI